MLQDHNPNNYHKRDPLSFCEGAFKGLTTMLPKGVNVVRQGGTFAISSAFPWLVFGRAIQEVRSTQYYSKEDWLLGIYRDAEHKFEESPKTTTLYLPAPSAAGVTTINASAGVGGGVHEAGHAKCDCANGRFPSFQEFRTKVGRHLSFNVPYHECNFPKWVNVTADMRLEPGMALEYPEVAHRFFAIQAWCHDLESEGRGRDVPSDFMMALRDSGKGWINDASKEIYSEYNEDARNLVAQLKPIWSELRPTNINWEETAHLPVYVAVEIINALHDFLKEPEGGGGQGGEGQDGEGQDGEGQGQGGDGDDKSGEGKESDTNAGKSPMSLDDIKRVLRGEGEALDPNKAMRREVQKHSQELDHALYIPNGVKPLYRKFL